MEAKKLFGQIYSPDAPDDIINGVWLTISETGIFIETELNSLKDQNWPVLHGVFNGLDKVTLINCDAGAGSSGRGGTWRKIWVSYLLKGCHIDSKSELEFKKLTVSCPALNKWIHSPNHIDYYDQSKVSIPPKELIVKFTAKNTDVIISLDYSRIAGVRSLDITRSCFLEIISEDKIHLDKFSEITTSLKKLVLFLTNKNPEYDQYYVVDENGEAYELIKSRNNLLEDQFTQNLNLSYFDFKSSLENVFQGWMEIEKLETIIDLIQEKQFNTDMSFQNYFLNLCVAIESFHYIFGDESGNEKIGIRNYDREQISELIIDKKLKKRFLDTSQRWNESTYRERLKSFKPTFEEIMSETFSFKSNSLINKIVDTRNALAHTGTYKPILKHIELLLIGKILEFTLKNEVLKLLKFEPQRENQILIKSKQHVETLARINDYNKKAK